MGIYEEQSMLNAGIFIFMNWTSVEGTHWVTKPSFNQPIMSYLDLFSVYYNHSSVYQPYIVDDHEPTQIYGRFILMQKYIKCPILYFVSIFLK